MYELNVIEGSSTLKNFGGSVNFSEGASFSTLV